MQGIIALQSSNVTLLDSLFPWEIQQDQGRTDPGLSPALNCRHLALGSSKAMEVKTERDLEVWRYEGQVLSRFHSN